MINPNKIKPVLISSNEAEDMICALYKNDEDGMNDWRNGYNAGISDAQDVILKLYDEASKEPQKTVELNHTPEMPYCITETIWK